MQGNLEAVKQVGKYFAVEHQTCSPTNTYMYINMNAKRKM